MAAGAGGASTPNRPFRAETRLALVRRARRLSRRLPEPWGRRVRELGKAVVDSRGARRSYLRGPLFALIGRHSRLLLARFGRAWLLVDSADMEVGRAVYITGDYERIYMESALGVLSSTGHSMAGKTFVDVGANLGTSTVDALVHFGFQQAVCFEPDERNLRLLRMNLILNGLDARASVHPVAVSDHWGELRLERSTVNFGDSRITEAPGQPVPGAPLDALLAEEGLTAERIGLVWIDVQGHEPFVLAGATALLEAGVPVVVEYSPGLLGENGTLDQLEKLIGTHYRTVVDLHVLAGGVSEAATLEAADVARLGKRYDPWDHTDLLLLR